MKYFTERVFISTMAPKRFEVTISVEWGYETHSIPLTPRNWARVKSGKELYIRGKGYIYEGELFWDYWHFKGGLEGDLTVHYGKHGDYSATGFDGKLRHADITTDREQG